jgi:hypothetical protein
VASLVAKLQPWLWCRLWLGLAESTFFEIIESGLSRPVLCLYVWKESGLNRSGDVFTFNLHNKDILQNFMLSVPSAKDNVAMNYVIVQQK